jgi:hypothetical protein
MQSNQRPVASFVLIVLTLASLFSILAFAPNARAMLLYDSGDPTPDEQLVLEMINRARANPIAEGQRLGIDIHEGLQDPNGPELVGSRPPLAMNPALLAIAQAHSEDMYNQTYFSHTDPNGTTAFQRMTNAGYDYARAGENMAAGTDMSAAELEDFMMVDSGTAGRLHRVNLLDIFPYPCGDPPCAYSEVGVGYYQGPTGQAFITEDFGATSYTGPFLTGVVYDDANGNNFYDVGEGIAGVTVTPSTGNYYAISTSSGGFAFPIGMSGTMTVTASGAGFGPVTKTVTLAGTNIELDFTPQDSSVATNFQLGTQTSSQPTITQTQASSQSVTQVTFTSMTQTSFESFTQSSTSAPLSLESVMFQSSPSTFPAATSPATITACGNTYTYSQSLTVCGMSFEATANLPTPAAGWEFDHWTWAGGVACSSNTANPTNCSAYNSGGILIAVYAAQVNVVTNPPSSALVSWVSCSNPGLGNGASFFSSIFGSGTVAACDLPPGYSFSNWICSGGLACATSADPTTVTFTGPGTITLNLQQTVNYTSNTTSSGASVSSTSVMSGFTSTYSTVTTVTYPIPEFDAGLALPMITILAMAILLMSRRRRP